MSIGERIRIKRIEKDMTQEELAVKVGYTSKSTINKIELGVNDIPLSKVREFARALDTTEAYLMGWEEESSSSFELSSDEQKLLLMFRSLNALGKTRALQDLEDLTQLERYIKISDLDSEAI